MYKGSIQEAFDLGYKQGLLGEGFYKGKHIYRFYRIDKAGYYRLDFSNIHTNSRMLQAIILEMSKKFKATFYIVGQRVKKPQGAYPRIQFWENDMPEKFSVYFHLEEGCVYIENACAQPLPTPVPYCSMGIAGCAIVIDELGENRYRFNCNDVDRDDDFDDLVFDLSVVEFSDGQEWLKEAKTKPAN